MSKVLVIWILDFMKFGFCHLDFLPKFKSNRTIKFKHPWTNVMVESFNKKIKNKLLTKYRFQSIIELNGKILEFVDDYNQNKRLKSLNFKTPMQYLKEIR